MAYEESENPKFKQDSRHEMLTINVNMNFTVIGQPRGNGHFRLWRDTARPFTFTANFFLIRELT